MGKLIRIGTRESQLAVWQATLVQELLAKHNYRSELVFVKTEGDIDLQTPLYEMGVQGIFTKTLDIALLNNKIDIAVHSMKDVPTQLANGIAQAAVLERASCKDILVYKGDIDFINAQLSFVYKDFSPNMTRPTVTTGYFSNNVEASRPFAVATSSIRRKAQWLHRYPSHMIENLRGNVNTRLRKALEHNWDGAIFAAAGLERINLRPQNSLDLDWMLPAPAQGAIMVVCREDDEYSLNACMEFNDTNTALCTKIERDFLKTLLGGCSTPISAFAHIKDGNLLFKGNVLSNDGREKVEIEKITDIKGSCDLGNEAAIEIINKGAYKITDAIKNAK